MKKEQDKIGIKVKFSIIAIWAHLLYLTWLVLISGFHPIRQVIALSSTIGIIYIHLILTHDYFFLKHNLSDKSFRRDIRPIEPLLTRKKK